MMGIVKLAQAAMATIGNVPAHHYSLQGPLHDDSAFALESDRLILVWLRPSRHPSRGGLWECRNLFRH